MVNLIIKQPYRKFINNDFVLKVAAFCLEYLSASTTDLTISITGDQDIRKLNKQFRKVDSPTDVLSFPSDEIDPQTNRRYVGDIVISFQRAKEQALDFNHSVMKEISILIIHGILHLFQYDHESQDEAKKMFSLQDEIMNELEIPNL